MPPAQAPQCGNPRRAGAGAELAAVPLGSPVPRPRPRIQARNRDPKALLCPVIEESPVHAGVWRVG